MPNLRGGSYAVAVYSVKLALDVYCELVTTLAWMWDKSERMSPKERFKSIGWSNGSTNPTPKKRKTNAKRKLRENQRNRISPSEVEESRQLQFGCCLWLEIDGKRIAFTGDNLFGNPADKTQNGHEAVVCRNTTVDGLQIVPLDTTLDDKRHGQLFDFLIRIR